jgi:hypothetical protein
MIAITESYEDSDWYNDPNCVMSRIIIKSRRDTHTLHLDEIHTHTSQISSRYIHTQTHRDYIMQHTSRSVNAIGYTITYQTPYNQCEWRTQSFTTLHEAQRMIEFYKSCGSPARLV